MTTFTNKAQEQVKEFHQAFNHPVSDKPKSLTVERTLNRCIWNGEELVEQLKAVTSNQEQFRNAFSNLLTGLRKAYEKESAKPFLTTEEERIIAQVDAIADRLYFTMGDVVEIGIDIQGVFDIVHEANMSKLFTDEVTGEKYAKYGDDNKVIKSPDFWSPEEKIAEEIKRQLENVKVEEKPKRKTTRKKKEVTQAESIELLTSVEPVESTIELVEATNKEIVTDSTEE